MYGNGLYQDYRKDTPPRNVVRLCVDAKPVTVWVCIRGFTPAFAPSYRWVRSQISLREAKQHWIDLGGEA
jgi:hypothetical protein